MNDHSTSQNTPMSAKIDPASEEKWKILEDRLVKRFQADLDELKRSNEFLRRRTYILTGKLKKLEEKDNLNQSKPNPSKASNKPEPVKRKTTNQELLAEIDQIKIDYELKDKWTLWLFKPEANQFAKKWTELDDFQTLKKFKTLLEENIENIIFLAIFKKDIKPLREDKNNFNGGMFSISSYGKNWKENLSKCWLMIALSVLQGSVEIQEITGVRMGRYMQEKSVEVFVKDDSKVKELEKLEEQLRDVSGKNIKYVKFQNKQNGFNK